jgi:PPK2 family polyphosphate:nucleotide phosphotransferase
MPSPSFKVESPVQLADLDAGYCEGRTQEETESLTQAYCKKIGELQRKLYAQGSRGLLIIFQGMDASGKDGVARKLLSAVDPAGLSLTSFKAPTRTEKEHDYLWRVHQAVPAYGQFGVWNRSHYEDILVPRVLQWLPKKVWQARHEQINAFEKLLVDNNYLILKFYLNITKEEQAKRLQQRMKEPHKQWKFEAADFEMRQYWDQFVEAYEEIFARCSTPYAPWYVIPSNRKWYRNFAVSRIVCETLESIHLTWPKPKMDFSQYELE